MRYEIYSKVIKYINKKLFNVFFSSNFNYFGKKVSIIFPDIIKGEKYISIYDNVVIQSKSWIMAYKQNNIEPILEIYQGVEIGRFAHIVSLQKVIIEKNVLIADKVYISDNIHQYEEITIPIKQQQIKFKSEVVIGENSWIGENVSIIGAKIGKHCIVGSNSVVTKDIMDYSIVVGIPAIYIKRYDISIKQWKKTNKYGEFI
jgi:acetyltransferase-like isoleucine patch superfamily enzyme